MHPIGRVAGGPALSSAEGTRPGDIDEASRRCIEECGARCCRYITLILPAPRRSWEFDEWSWFLAHENVSIYFAGRRWRMEIRSQCRYLSDQNACTIYERRPDICRLYSQEYCEYAGRAKHLYHFDTKEEFDRWWEEKRERERRKRTDRSRLPRARRPTASKRKARAT